MTSLTEKLTEAREILSSAIDEYKPAKVFGLFSGGHDSLTVTHFAAGVTKLDSVIHIDTGIGIPETQQFVIDTCRGYDWPLKIYRAKDCGQDYDTIVKEHGFPGPNQHQKMFIRLKERPIDAMMRDNKGGLVMLISGVRLAESGRRFRTIAAAVQKKGRKLWVAPFINLTGDDVAEYRETFNLPNNEVKQYLCMSGECLCGAYAKPNELKQIETFYPETGAKLRQLERDVFAAGFPWGWDEKPPAWWGKRQAAIKAGQTDGFATEADEEIQMLCTTCQFKHEAEDSLAHQVNK